MIRITNGFPFGTIFAVFLCGTNDLMVQAQVVQLPSTRSLGYSGSAWVPDGGTAYLGGNGSSSYGSRTSGWGPSANRASGNSLVGSSLTASVRIIDLAALDEAILADGRASSAAASAADPSATTAASVPIHPVSKASAGGAASSGSGARSIGPAESIVPRIGANSMKWQIALSGGGDAPRSVPSMLESDIRFYIQKGEAAEKAGSVLAAQVYYKMASDLMPPELIDRYHRIVAERKGAEEARIKAEAEAVRRQF